LQCTEFPLDTIPKPPPFIPPPLAGEGLRVGLFWKKIMLKQKVIAG